MRIKPGGVRAGIEIEKEVLFGFNGCAGAIATDGVQYSSIATFGTTAVQVLSERIDPGYTLKLRTLEVGLAQRFTGLNGSFVASIIYHWQAQSDDYMTPEGTLLATALVPITGTYQKAVGTITTSDDVFSGYIPIGSVPFLPARFILTAIGIQAAICQGRVKSSSYIRGIGIIIPGT